MHPRPAPGRWTAAADSGLMVALFVAEPPGTTPVRLAAGTYVFRTTADAQIQVSEDAAIEVTAVRAPADKGDSLPDHVPTLTVLRVPAAPRPAAPR